MVTTTNAMHITSLICRGNAYSRGLQQGEQLRPLIKTGVGNWLENLGALQATDPDEYIREFVTSTGHQNAIERWTPDLLSEVKGIAEGSRQPFERILAYNMLDEEWHFGHMRRQRLAPGCTAAGFRTLRKETPVIGQTMDIPTVHDGTQCVVCHMPESGPEIMVFTAAGMIGLMGVNSAGVGVVVNNLAMLPSSIDGVPVTFIERELLRQSNASQAKTLVESVPHAIGQHYLIGDSTTMISIEGSAGSVLHDLSGSHRFAHTNHPLIAADPYDDVEETHAVANSRRRLERMWEIMPSLNQSSDLERALADTLAPISRSPLRGSMTFGAMVAELAVPPVVRIAPGPPHERPFVDFEFARAR